jgi:DNA recombination protein RmuC
VLFVPGDPFLEAALRADPALLEHAFSHNVVVATPTTLIALLRTVAHTWRQEALAHNAAQVHQLGKELHSRLATMGSHVAKLGRSLDAAVVSYNQTVSSLESRVLVTARRLTELKVADGDLDAPGQVERGPRTLAAPELVASAAESLIGLHDLERDTREERDTAREGAARAEPRATVQR